MPSPPPQRKAPPKQPPKGKLNPTGHVPNVPKAKGSLPESYYDEASTMYYVRASDGQFLRYSGTDLRSNLCIRGFSVNKVDGIPSEVDEVMEQIRDKSYVRYAGPLGGHKAGRYVISGTPILVTAEADVPPPTFGSNMIVRDYIERLVGHDQASYLHGWLKLGREALDAGSTRRGQVLVIAGEPDHGKSLLATQVIIPIFGGRHAEPHQGMVGATTFNEDWFGAEVLLMDDPGSDDKWSTRKAFGDAIKQMVGNQAPRCHGKGRKALILTPFWRMVVTVNSELENLQVLPPLVKGIVEKMIIVKTKGRAAVFKTRSIDDYMKFQAALRAGIGDYLGWLSKWKLPEALWGERFGMESFAHPEIVEALKTFSPEERLLDLIDDEILVGDDTVPMVMTARQVERELMDSNSSVLREADHLLRSVGSIGKYLSRLAMTRPLRVSRLPRSNGEYTYKLTPKGRYKDVPAADIAALERDARSKTT